MTSIPDSQIIQNQTTIYNDQSLAAHYSTQTKISIPKRVVAKGPTAVPEHHIFTDAEANAKLSAINKDIFEQSQKVPKPKNKKKKFFGLL